MLASSSNSSEWNNDDKWSSQVRNSGEMSNTSTGRPVSNELVIDIDMDSDTAAESDLSLKSRSFLNKVNDRLRKMLVSESTCTIDHKVDKACDKRLNRLISYIHHTCEYKQYCHVENIVKQCRLGLFQDSDVAGKHEDSTSTSGGTLCIFGSHIFVTKSWMCKKQTSVSHSSTESEIISLDAGLRLDGIPALDFFWDLIVAVLHGNTHLNDQVR